MLAALHSCDYRAANQARFKCLPAVSALSAHDLDSQVIGNFFLASKRSSVTQRSDILYVHTDGSFCCTAPYGQNLLAPQRIEWAAVVEGFAGINPALHWGEVHQQSFVPNLSTADKVGTSTYTTQRAEEAHRCCLVTSTCRPDYGCSATAASWCASVWGAQQCANKSPTSSTAASNPAATVPALYQQAGAASTKEALTKSHFENLPHMCKSLQFRTEYYALIQNHANRRELEARTQRAARHSALYAQSMASATSSRKRPASAADQHEEPVEDAPEPDAVLLADNSGPWKKGRRKGVMERSTNPGRVGGRGGGRGRGISSG